MTTESNEPQAGLGRIIRVGLLLGLLLNITGWLGNNLLLRPMWAEVGAGARPVAWRESVWSDVFSLVPDFVYGLAIAWLCVALRARLYTDVSAALRAGLLVSVVGGMTTYFAIANSGFIPWRLALVSFALVLATKMPLAMLAGRLLHRRRTEPLA